MRSLKTRDLMGRFDQEIDEELMGIVMKGKEGGGNMQAQFRVDGVNGIIPHDHDTTSSALSYSIHEHAEDNVNQHTIAFVPALSSHPSHPNMGQDLYGGELSMCGAHELTA